MPCAVAAGVVDDVGDRADVAERDGEQVVELHAGVVRHLEGVVGVHRRVDVEVAVAAQAPGLVRGDVGADLVGGVAVEPSRSSRPPGSAGRRASRSGRRWSRRPGRSTCTSYFW